MRASVVQMCANDTTINHLPRAITKVSILGITGALAAPIGGGESAPPRFLHPYASIMLRNRDYISLCVSGTQWFFLPSLWWTIASGLHLAWLFSGLVKLNAITNRHNELSLVHRHAENNMLLLWAYRVGAGALIPPGEQHGRLVESNVFHYFIL
jgi:hypothetical protein